MKLSTPLKAVDPRLWVISLAAVGSVLVPGVALAHSGGLDEFGCHAGSVPYHCHGGGAPSAPSIPEPSPSEPVGPTPEEIREQEQLEELSGMEAEAAALSDDVDAAFAEAEAADQSAREIESVVAGRKQRIDTLRAQAAERRADLTDQRLDAVNAAELAAAKHQEDVEAHRSEQALLAAAAGFAIVILLAAALAAKLTTAGLFVSLRAAQIGIRVLAVLLPGLLGGGILALALSIASEPLRIALGVFGGMSFGAAVFTLLQLIRTAWLLPARFVLGGVALLGLAVSLVALVSASQPTAPVPPPEHQQLIAAHEQDPSASTDPEAARLGAKASRIDQATADERAVAEQRRALASDLQRAATSAQTQLNRIERSIENLRQKVSAA